MSRVLVVDDEPTVLHLFRAGLEHAFQVATAAQGLEALASLREQSCDAVLLDIYLPGGLAHETVLPEMLGLDPHLAVVLITGHFSAELAIEGTERGAYAVLPKGIPLAELQEALHRAVETTQARRAGDGAAPGTPAEAAPDGLVGQSLAMRRVYQEIALLAPGADPVLLLGESGTGKELVARALHGHSPRKEEPFVPVNCAAQTETLLESAFFGHERGAFTGAEDRHVGLFEQASVGTLFLDEIGDLPLPMQAKLLRVLEDQCFQRVGGTEPLQTRARIIAATNRELGPQNPAKQFRPELYHRLAVHVLYLPSLRSRKEDLPHLVRHLLQRICHTESRPRAALSPEAFDWLVLGGRNH